MIIAYRMRNITQKPFDSRQAKGSAETKAGAGSGAAPRGGASAAMGGEHNGTDPAKPSSTAARIASLMDDFIRIPGTDIRIGLDPILGLFPGLGDTVASLVGVAIIGEASRRGVSRLALVTMALNILANAAVGAIPVVGDLFSVWFKSNRRNHDLLQKALSKEMSPADREKAVRKASGFAVLLITGVILGVILIIIGSLAVLKLIFEWMAA